ncbi:hypothetical protein SAY86_023924 [Trapa natans]|uniref:Protein SHORTAGE IN CHIASMATA 1 n=1 Tax=Trapa natans TaxID=22666 RepID=A0AAN7R678_TRANT|nr:hypothetical protein SAY86_023924 [Trapa natans]
MILEYGGSCSTSRIITLFPEFSGHPCLHFLKVEINKLSAAQALCEGVGMPQQIIMEVERETQFVKCVEEYIDLSKLEALLNFVPLLDEMGNSNTKFLADPSIPHEAFSAEANNNWTGIMSFPEIVIIMNTLSTEKEMIVSRRSTYQKILALEEMGAQVIERDSNLPADIIISPTACLVWYECSNMQTKSSGPHEVSSWLPCYVEDIATNILSFLSYSFSCCILIFEGESDFLSNVMETSDGLYAAAASLGVDLQLFCSYSAELTDEIILSCIGIGTRLIKGLFPKIPEAETLAESFLSKFPSINPLTAHSIISNGGILADFLGWSYESRVNAVKKYHVPDESISLFSALCRYGEREDSQSIMTDTSSSVSSGPDTRKYYGDLGSENKRCKYTVVPPNRGKPPDVLLQGGSSKQYIDSTLAFHEISKVDAWESSKDKLTDRKGHESSLKKIVEKEELDSAFTRFPPKFTDPLDCNLQKVMDLPNSSVKQSLHWNIASADPYLGIEEATISSLKWPSSRNADTMTEKVKGTIDLVDHAVFNPIDFSFLVQDMNGDSTTEPEYSFGHGDLRTFPTAAEIESSPCCTSPAKHKKYSSMGGGVDYKIPSHQHKNETSHLKYESALTTAGFDERSSINIPSTAIRRDGSNFRGTPLRDALHSSYLQKGSPWTMEFLNRIREKSKLHQRSLLPEASPSLSIRKNIPNRTKRRSPSIHEFFKYQGGSTVRKIPKQKRQKTTSQSLGSFKNEKAISISMSGTPDDKRARRKLSYTTNEIGSQTRLVWSERSTYNRA